MIVMTGADNEDKIWKPSPALKRLQKMHDREAKGLKCPLCSLDLKKEKIYYSDQNIVVLRTKDLKGHVERIMIVSVEHRHNIQYEEPAFFEWALDVLTQIGKKVFKYTPKFVIMDSTFATMNEHWHLVATDLAPQSEDFEQILRTKWIKVIDQGWD